MSEIGKVGGSENEGRYFESPGDDDLLENRAVPPAELEAPKTNDSGQAFYGEKYSNPANHTIEQALADMEGPGWKQDEVYFPADETQILLVKGKREVDPYLYVPCRIDPCGNGEKVGVFVYLTTLASKKFDEDISPEDLFRIDEHGGWHTRTENTGGVSIMMFWLNEGVHVEGRESRSMVISSDLESINISGWGRPVIGIRTNGKKFTTCHPTELPTKERNMNLLCQRLGINNTTALPSVLSVQPLLIEQLVQQIAQEVGGDGLLAWGSLQNGLTLDLPAPIRRVVSSAEKRERKSETHS